LSGPATGARFFVVAMTQSPSSSTPPGDKDNSSGARWERKGRSDHLVVEQR
jgi:hypothetical protein